MEAEEKNNIIPPNLLQIPTNWTSEVWARVEESLYQIFVDTLVSNKPIFRGLPVNIRKTPKHKGKDCAFWHLISEGEKEEERITDLKRCERLGWINWIIVNCDSVPDHEICWFEDARPGEKSLVVLWYLPEDYAVILAKRSNYFLLKTAYPLKPGRKAAFQKKLKEFKKRKQS